MLGGVLPFNKENAQLVAELKVQSWLDVGYSTQKIFLFWNSGEGQKRCVKSGKNAKIKYDSCKYVADGMKNLLTLTAYAEE